MLGQIDDRTKLKVLSSADCMIIPSYEAFPKTLLEGLLSGLYILTSKRNSAWQDFVDFGIRMFVAENDLPKEYLQFIIRLIGKKGEHKDTNAYKESNRKKTIKNFNKRSILPKIFDMFQRVENNQ